MLLSAAFVLARELLREGPAPRAVAAPVAPPAEAVATQSDEESGRRAAAADGAPAALLGMNQAGLKHVHEGIINATHMGRHCLAHVVRGQDSVQRILCLLEDLLGCLLQLALHIQQLVAKAAQALGPGLKREGRNRRAGVYQRFSCRVRMPCSAR